MKKIASLILAVVLLCSCAAALAEVPPIPNLGSFAVMTTMTKKNVISITLTKPVDKLYVNWPSDLNVTELSVTEGLMASVNIAGQKTQPGVVKTVVVLNAKDGPEERLVATDQDRAFITLQGEWFVCYNRKGEIVDVSYAGATFNVQDLRDLAFSQVREPLFDGFGILKVVKKKTIIVPAKTR